MYVLSLAQSCPIICSPMNCSHARLPLSGDFSDENTGVGCHFSPAGDLSNPGIEPMSPGFLALQVDSLSAEPSRMPKLYTDNKKRIREDISSFFSLL